MERGIIVTASILVGTCSWTDKSSRRLRLLLPAGREDARSERSASTPHASPSSRWTAPTTASPPTRNAALWVERTPPEFIFDIKAFRLLHPPPDAAGIAAQGHARDPADRARGQAQLSTTATCRESVRDDVWQRFADALLPLDSAGKLGVVLFQFPPWFLPGHDSEGPHPRGEGDACPSTASPSSSATTAGSPNATATALSTSCASNRIPLVCVDEPQGIRIQRPAALRGDGRRSPSFASTAATAKCGSARAHRGGALRLPLFRG